MSYGKCEICGATDISFWRRCKEHYRCDDCGGCKPDVSLCTYGEGVLCQGCHDKRVAKRIAEFDKDTDYTNEAICPWCGYEYGDTYEMPEGDNECSDCGNKFNLSRDVDVTYCTSKEAQ